MKLYSLKKKHAWGRNDGRKQSEKNTGAREGFAIVDLSLLIGLGRSQADREHNCAINTINYTRIIVSGKTITTLPKCSLTHGTLYYITCKKIAVTANKYLIEAWMISHLCNPKSLNP